MTENRIDLESICEHKNKKFGSSDKCIGLIV